MTANVSPTLIAEGAIRYWHLMFLWREIEHWWDIFNPPSMRHVLAYGYNTDCECWVIVNPAQSMTVVQVMNEKAFDLWLSEQLTTKPQVFRAPAKEGSDYSNRIIQTCTTVVARLIGYPSALRPITLMRMLAAQKAERVFVDEHQNESP